MLTLRRFAEMHPLAFSALLTLFRTSMALAAGWVVLSLYPEIPPAGKQWVNWMLYSLLAIALLSGLGWWRDVGFTRLPRWRDLRLFWFPMLLPGLFLVAGIETPPPAQLALYAGGALLVGFNEEAIFRGVILRALLPTGIRRAAVWSALLFGSVHLFNVVLGASPAYGLVQTVAAASAGLAFAALRLRLGSIWPMIAYHAFVDTLVFTFMEGAGQTDPRLPALLGAWLVINLAMGVYGWWLLRRVPATAPVEQGQPAPAAATGTPVPSLVTN